MNLEHVEPDLLRLSRLDLPFPDLPLEKRDDVIAESDPRLRCLASAFPDLLELVLERAVRLVYVGAWQDHSYFGSLPRSGVDQLPPDEKASLLPAKDARLEGLRGYP